MMNNLEFDNYLEKELKKIVNFLYYTNRIDWLKLRELGIGGSDMYSIILQTFKTQFDVYMDKLGLSEEQPDNMRMKLGRMLESTVIQLFKEDTGLDVIEINSILQHKEYPYFLANVDGIIKYNDKEDYLDSYGILECKTTGLRVTEDNYPEYYYLQIQWYLYITGLEKGVLAILDRVTPHFFIVPIHRDNKLIDNMVKIADKFWNDNVIKKIPPVFNSASDLNQLYPRATNKNILTLDSQADRLIEGIGRAKKEKKEYELIQNNYENELKGLLGNYQYGETSNVRISWGNVTKQYFDKKACQENNPDIIKKYTIEKHYRTFRITNKNSK